MTQVALSSKLCTRCGLEKCADQFYVSKVVKSGLRSKCIACESIGAAARTRAWYAENKERANASTRKYVETHADSLKIAAAIWIEKNKERVLATKRRYREKHKEVLAVRQRERIAANPAAKKAAVAKWDAKNRDKRQAGVRHRRAVICAATPSFDNEFDLFVQQEVRRLASLRKSVCGGEWEVDHIEPLRSKEVCGLHNAYNFQVVPRAYNRSKGNRRVESHWLLGC